ncbi:chromosome transmission fidelity protein 8 [Paragonimus westermani]|uniref:Chromosome transmission fidelity protein 8 n=1 Tax=Paragonimus westermani TaxID=34504 RepID=A0A5J4NR20_9TREM|nr:chromosome transmission fidelity protein 8 [Paragonimus westermani]
MCQTIVIIYVKVASTNFVKLGVRTIYVANGVPLRKQACSKVEHILHRCLVEVLADVLSDVEGYGAVELPWSNFLDFLHGEATLRGLLFCSNHAAWMIVQYYEFRDPKSSVDVSVDVKSAQNMYSTENFWACLSRFSPIVPMIIRIRSPQGETDEWLLLELQGEIVSKSGSLLAGKHVGDLHFSQQASYFADEPVFIIGHHVLFGKVSNLEKPLIVTEKNSVNGVLEYSVVAVIRRKLLFKTRPKPIIVSVSKKP